MEFIGAVRGSAVSDRASPSRCCCKAICPTISWSVWQSYSANTCHLGLIIHSVLVARAAPTWISKWYRSLATAGCAWPVQVQSSNFSPGTCPSRSPTYSPVRVTLHAFSSAYRVSLSSCQAEWLCSIANLKSLNAAEQGTTSSSNN